MATKPDSVSTGLDLNAVPQFVPSEPMGRGIVSVAFCAYDPSYVIPAGIVTYDTDTPGTISSLSNWAPGSYGFCTGGTYDLDGNMFMTDYSSSNSAFYSIDTTTWVATLVGSIGHSVHAMTCDPSTGTIYVAGGSGNAANLYTVDPASGASTLVGAFGGGLAYVLQLACDADGNMYAIDISTDMFYSVNKDTGAATQIGSTGLALNYAQDMCYSSEASTLFLAGYSSFGAEYTVNTATGQCTLVGQFAGSMEVDALCYPLVPPIDDDAPVTTCTIEGTGPVTITLTATDATGVAYTMYKIDDGTYANYTAPVTFGESGTHTVWFYSVDVLGNIEEPKSQEFTIEATLTIAIKGGMGITATITNDGTAAVDIDGTIAVTGLVFPKSKDFSSPAVAAGADATWKMTAFGIGPTTIKVTANGVEKTASGFVLLVFVLGVK